MAAIYIDNIIKPKNSFKTNVDVSKSPEKYNYVYKDLHLDIEFEKIIGNGINVANAGDLLADYDKDALSTSIYNIFNSRKGFKLLDPGFGCSLDQFLFQRITTINGRNLGSYILNQIEKYEPRIYVNKVIVEPDVDENLYNVAIYYRILNIKRDESLKLQFEANKINII